MNLEKPTGTMEGSRSPACGRIAAWRVAGECGDAAAAVACLAGEVIVLLPAVGRYRFCGRESMRQMLAVAFDLIEDLRYESVTDGGGPWTLSYCARIAGHPITATQRLKLDSDSLICEITLPGSVPKVFVDAMERIGPRLVAPPRPRPGQRRASRGRPAPG